MYLEHSSKDNVSFTICCPWSPSNLTNTSSISFDTLSPFNHSKQVCVCEYGTYKVYVPIRHLPYPIRKFFEYSKHLHVMNNIYMISTLNSSQAVNKYRGLCESFFSSKSSIWLFSGLSSSFFLCSHNVCLHILVVRTWIHSQNITYSCKYTHVHILTYTYSYTLMYTHILFIYTYLRTYSYTYSHTHIYSYTCFYVQESCNYNFYNMYGYV